MSRINTKIIESNSFNPYINLALEEYLLNNLSNKDLILYLWQNENTVVIGRNQNPWKECKIKNLHRDKGKLVRRLSGGGAVYHDKGNLNFTFLASEDIYDLEKQLKVILNAVKSLGIMAEFKGRNDLIVEEKKFSGNAFYTGKKGKIHHGTLLIDVDINKLQKYLQVSEKKIKSKGIYSIRSRVVNLKSLNPSLEIEIVKKALINAFVEEYKGHREIIDSTPICSLKTFKDLYNKYSSWKWSFGETPEFDVILEERFPWGGIEIGLNIVDGKIKEAMVFSDSLDVNIISSLPQHLRNLSFDYGIMANELKTLHLNNEDRIINDIVKWLENKR